MTSKKYALTLAGLLFVFFCLNFILWHFMVKTLYINDNGHGDLSRIENFFTTEPITHQASYFKRHTEFQNYIKSSSTKNFDVITIGDSFSNGQGGCFYQDYLTDKYNLEILNIQMGEFNSLEMLYALDYSGWLDELKPRFAILESVERACNESFGLREIKLNDDKLKLSHEQIFKMTNSKDNKTDFKKIFPSVMVKANIKFLRANFSRLKNLNPYITKLNQPMFTNPGQEDLLLFLDGDLGYLEKPFNAEQINKNFNDAEKYFASKGVKIIFMPCVDKFNLYYPYIENNKYPHENNFFDEIEKLDKNYTLINTKKILRKLLAQGEKDVYWLDDTHWSWKAQQAVGDEIAKIILSN